MEERKVKWKNVSIVLIVSAFSIIIGFIDRAVNHVGPLETVVGFFARNVAAVGNTPSSSEWYNTSVELSSTVSSFNLGGFAIIAIAGVFVMIVMFSCCRFAA